MRAIGFIVLLGVAVATPAFAGDIAPGRQAFGRDGCAACHAVTSPGPGFTLADRVAQKGPDLWFAGSKFNRAWLVSWLPAPTPLLGIGYAHLEPDPDLVQPHPAAPAGDAEPIADYLMSLKDPQMATGVIPLDGPMPRMEKLDGRIMFGKEQQCFACHQTRTRYGALVGGKTAPTLVNAGARLNPDWVFAYLTNPLRYVPVTRMPIYTGTAFPGYDTAQMKILARYIVEMDQ